MKSMKFRVRGEDHSRQIQEALFGLGFRWSGNHGHVAIFLASPFLYANDDGATKFLYVGGGEKFFTDDDGVECDVVDGLICATDSITVTTLATKPEPPVGLRPRHIAEQQRMLEIVEAIQRYVVEYKHIPDDWLCELADLNTNILVNEKN